MSGTDRVAVVNEEFARAFGDPSSLVGRMITGGKIEPRRIIGVVRGMRDSGPLYPPSPQMFLPARSSRSLTFVVKVSGTAKDHIATLRDALATVDARVPVFDVKTMDERLALTLARPKIGVYGVVSYACGERIRELGIRLALGTTPARLRGRLVWRIVRLVSAGALAGSVFVSTGAAQLRNLIPGSEATLLTTLVVAIAGTLAVAIVATWAATHRVASLDIMAALRPE